MILNRIAVPLSVFMLIMLTSSAQAMEPMETIKTPIDIVITILNDPQYKVKGSKIAQRKKIWTVVKPMFDFDEISKRTVARNWKDFSAAEKTAFSDVFAQFLGNTYIDKIQGEYHNEQIVYLGQEIRKEIYARVMTRVIRETVQIPVNYRMRKDGEGLWKVYDVTVEGVSMIENYRQQFATILSKETPAQLIQRLNEKLVAQDNRLSDDG